MRNCGKARIEKAASKLSQEPCTTTPNFDSNFHGTLDDELIGEQEMNEIVSEDDFSSRDDADLESMFSWTTFSSKTSLSLNEQQHDAANLLKDLLFDNDDLHELFMIASERVSFEKLQRNLRDLFQNYGKNLEIEANSESERRAASFVFGKAGYVAREIKSALREEKPAIPLPDRSTAKTEQMVNQWLASTASIEESQNRGLTKQEHPKLSPSPQSVVPLKEGESGKEEDDKDLGEEDLESNPAAEDFQTSYKAPDELKYFLVASEAFQTLRIALRRWIQLETNEVPDMVVGHERLENFVEGREHIENPQNSLNSGQLLNEKQRNPQDWHGGSSQETMHPIHHSGAVASDMKASSVLGRHRVVRQGNKKI